MISFLLQLAGLAAVITGGFMIDPGVGVVACGASLVYVGLAVEAR